jgi:FkbM family methyltransferase
MITSIRERFHPLWRLRKLAWYRWLQRRVDFAVSAGRGRIKFRVMLLRDFSLLAPHREAETISQRVFEGVVSRWGATHFFDVGANVGSYAWRALEAAPAARVFLFEPDPVNVRLIRQTLEQNALGQASLWEGVVAGSAGPRTFYVDEASGTVGSLQDDSAQGYSLQSAYRMGRSVKVPATTLDNYAAAVEAAGARVVVKVDVEGAEAEVFDGGGEFIRRWRPVMLVECFELKNLRRLREWGYARVDLRQGANYLLVPRERVEELQAARVLPIETLAPELQGQSLLEVPE